MTQFHTIMTIWNKLFIKLCPHIEWKRTGWCRMGKDSLSMGRGNVTFICKVCGKLAFQRYEGEPHMEIKRYEQKWEEIKL